MLHQNLGYADRFKFLFNSPSIVYHVRLSSQKRLLLLLPSRTMSHPLYSKLDITRREIRLLQIEAAAPEEPIHSTLQVVSLDDNPEYLALSYVWGDPQATRSIVVNGHVTCVTINLAEALRQIRAFRVERQSRFENLPVYIWADALSINQQDLLERTSQVQLMGQIYSNAHTVISWLGLEEHGSFAAIQLLRTMANEIRFSKHVNSRGNQVNETPNVDWVERYPNLYQKFLPNASGAGDFGAWEDVRELLQFRSYWSRLWILQEQVLAKRNLLVCGIEILDWASLVELRKWTEAAMEWPSLRPGYMDGTAWSVLLQVLEICTARVEKMNSLRNISLAFREVASKRGRKLSLPILAQLSLTRTAQSTDPRDKVFGLLGMTGNSIVPDYTKPVEEVYLDVARDILRSIGLKAIIQCAGIVSRSHLKLPSWVLDWSTPEHPGVRSTMQTVKDFLASATADKYEIEGSILKVTGFCLSTVDSVQSVPAEKAEDLGATQAMQTLAYAMIRYDHGTWASDIPPLQLLVRSLFEEPSAIRASHISAADLIRAEVFLCILRDHAINNSSLGDCPWPVAKLPDLSRDDNCMTILTNYYRGPNSDPTDLTGPTPNISDTEFSMRVAMGRHFKTERKAFFTRNGFLGFCPSGIEPGDYVFLFNGCAMPAIFRQIGSHYILVSGCDILGLTEEQVEAYMRNELLEIIEIH